jgi:Ca2+-binding EF-hand superfamily protein
LIKVRTRTPGVLLRGSYQLCIILTTIVDKDDRITKEELTTIMHDLGFPATKSQIDEMMKEADTDGNGTLDFDEFASAWSNAGENEQDGEKGSGN